MTSAGQHTSFLSFTLQNCIATTKVLRMYEFDQKGDYMVVTGRKTDVPEL